MQSSNKTGLVYKISVLLFVLLAMVVYKLNDYFKNEKLYATEIQLRNKVVQVKTTVSSQLSQLKNILSSYETELADSNINWVQLDPFFAIAKLDNTGTDLKVNQMLVRSNTPAERWNAAYLEKALSINKTLQINPILTQLFQDKTGAKFLIIRFKTGQNKELALIGAADYFQKFFDNERGESSTVLLVTTENLLVAHSEGDYIATQTQEAKFSKKKYLLEKDEIVGTNLIVMNYILKKKIAAGFVVPWSIIGVISGIGCILIAILFYNLDPMERKVERYKKQERAQIYKDTVSNLVDKTLPADSGKIAAPDLNVVQPSAPITIFTQPSTVVEKKQIPPKDFYSIEKIEKTDNEFTMTTTKAAILTPQDEITKTLANDNLFNLDNSNTNIQKDQFLSLNDSQIDLSDIEKALALDDFDSEESIASTESLLLKVNLTSQKISISATGIPVDKPQFSLKRKDFKVNEFKVNIRRPEQS